MSTYDNVKIMATGKIEQAKDQAGGQLTSEMIREEVIATVAFAGATAEDVDVEELIAEFERDYHTFVGKPQTLNYDEDGWEPWVAKSKAEIDWRWWERYRTYLLHEQRLPKPVVDALDETTDETLNNLRDPNDSGTWDRRGMVVGHVQAGKTTNYAGLICKAADAGYKVIVVLTGFHNNLRTQTQVRLEEAFVGYDKSASQGEGGAKAVGVGLKSSDPALRVDTITDRSEKGDFSRQVANRFAINPGGKPLVFVVKKNASVLNNLVQYLEYVSTDKDEKGQPKISKIPLLLIDDEADQGSVDTKKMELSEIDENGDYKVDPDHDPTKLNGLIRRILHIFSQSAYVGYTATPFANIFIHSGAKTNKFGEDLFPRSFITVMPTPSNYVGPEKVFGLGGEDGETRDEGLPIVRQIDDFAASMDLAEIAGWMPPKHKKDHLPQFEGKTELPPSLREAIYAFILACATRVVRGQDKKHNSMLIHVTRFVDTQERVYDQVRGKLQDVKDILSYGEEGSRDELLGEIKKLWQLDFKPTTRVLADDLCPEHNWPEVSEKIIAVVKSIQVKRINGSAGDALEYQQHQNSGLNVIAIGGDKLSRGLTLEGLTVSYFTRPSRMYDTLMQMGRWFGYRDGFIDVCRLYAPESLVEWFEHITDASEELRREFLLMCEMGETPANYGQRVQSHPVLMVTSQVKMRHTAEMKCSYQGAISETIVFSREGTEVDNNFEAANQLIEKISTYASMQQRPVRDTSDKVTKGKYLWSGVSPDDILAFLKTYKTPQHARRVNTTLLAQYIEKQMEAGDLGNWSVLIAGKEPTKDNAISMAGCLTGQLKRANHPVFSEEPSTEPSAYRIRRLVSPQDEAWDLSEPRYADAMKLEERREDGSERSYPGGPEIRANRDKNDALLILYPLKSQEFTQPVGTDKGYMGFAVSFPGNKAAKPITYRVNEVYQGQVDV